MAKKIQAEKQKKPVKAQASLAKRMGRARRVPHGSTHEDIYLRLKLAIMSARFIPGERLVVSQLEKAFGTSAMPIREALRRLVAEQALENSPNRGVQVPLMTAGRLSDLRRVRCEIEGLATEWAAAHITTEELEELQAIQDRINSLVAAHITQDYLDLNMQFHFTMYRAARSPLLMPIIESLWLQAGPSLNAMRMTPYFGVGIDHHDENLKALRKRDGKAARAGLEHEITEAAEIILASLASNDDESR